MKRPLFCGLTLLGLSGLTASAQSIAIRYSGAWTNLTFGSTGQAFIDASIDPPNAVLKFDLDGFVFGTFDPPLITMPGTVQNGILVFDARGVAGFGDIFGSVNIVTGETSINVTNVPNPSIKSVQLAGTITTKLDLQYSVEFPGPPSVTNPARGVIVAEGIPALRISAVELAGGELTVKWEGGAPPFQVQSSTQPNGGWQNSGAPRNDRMITLPSTGARGFIRVLGQ